MIDLKSKFIFLFFMKLRLPLRLMAAVIACLSSTVFTSYSADSYSVSLGSVASGPGLGLVDTSEWFSTNTAGTFKLKNNSGIEGASLTIGNLTVWSYGSSPNAMMKGYSYDKDVSINVTDIGFDTYDIYIYFSENPDKTDKFSPITVNGTTYTGSTSGIEEGTAAWGFWKSGEAGPLLGVNTILVEGLTGNELSMALAPQGSSINSIAGFQIVKSAAETIYSANLTGASANWSDAIWTKNAMTGNWVNSTDTSNSAAHITAAASGTTVTVGGTAAAPVKMGTISLLGGKLTLNSGTIEMGYREKLLVAANSELTLGASLTLNATNLIMGGTGTIYYNTTATSYTQANLSTECTLVFKDDMSVTLNTSANIKHLKTGSGKLTLGASGTFFINNMVLGTGATAMTGLAATSENGVMGLNLGSTTSLSLIELKGAKLSWDPTKTLTIASFQIPTGANSLGKGTLAVTGSMIIKTDLTGESSTETFMQTKSVDLHNGTVAGIGWTIDGNINGYGGGSNAVTVRNSAIVVTGSYSAGVNTGSGFHTAAYDHTDLLVKGKTTNNGVDYSLGLGNWGFGSSFTQKGGRLVTVSNFAITLDGSSSFTLSEDGFLGSPGIVTNVRNTAEKTATLTMDSGTIVLGAGGMRTNGDISASIITLKQGTLASSADAWSSPLNMTIGGAAGNKVTVDTTKYDIAGDNYVYTKGTGSAQITLSGILSGPGGLTKDGAGWLVLSGTGTNTYSGGTIINAGGIEIAKTSALGTGNLTLNNGSSMLLTTNATIGGSLTLNGNNAIIVSSGNSLTVNSSVSYGSGSLTTLKLNGTFTTGSSTPITIVQAAGHNFTGEDAHWNILFTKRSTADISFSNGSISFTNLQNAPGQNITWAGGNNGVWEAIGNGWVKTGTTQADVYYDADNTTFGPDHAGTVTLIEPLAPGKMILNGSYTFSGSGTLNGSFDIEILGGNSVIEVTNNRNGGNTIVTNGSLWLNKADHHTGQITLGANGTLQLGSTSSVFSTFEHAELTGGGTLQLWCRGNLSATGGSDGNQTTIKLGTGFNGTLEMKSGLLNWNTSENVLKANASASGANLILNGGGLVTTLDPELHSYNSIIIGEKGATLRIYGAKRTTYHGSVTGSGSISHTDGGYLTFKDISGFTGAFINERGSVTFESAIHMTDLTSNANNDGSLVTITGKANSSVSGSIKLNTNSSLTMDIGKENTLETTNFLVSGTAAQTVTLTSGTLKVTGTNNSRSQSALSFSLNTAGTGSNTTVLTVSADAAIDAANTVMASGWEGNSTLNLEGGTINVKGLCSSNPTNAVALNLKSGIVKLGDYGITDYQWSTANNVGSTVTDAMVSLTLGTVEIIAQANLSIDPHRLTDNATDIVTLTDATTGTTFNSNGYIITVNDCLVGAGKVVKTGTGTLILQKAGTYAGGTVINGGILRAAQGAALGTADVSVNNDGVLQLTGTEAYANNITLNGSSSKLQWDTDTSGTVTGTLNGVISGSGTLEKTGSGTMKITSDQALTGFNGIIHIVGGKLQLGNIANGKSITTGNVSSIVMETGADLFIYGGDNAMHSIGSNVTIQGNSTISLQAGYNGRPALELQGILDLKANLTLVKTWAKQIGITGTLTGTGDLIYNPTIGDNNAWQENNKLIISSANANYTGTVRMLKATTADKKRPGWLVLQNDNALSSAKVELIENQSFLVVDTANATLKGLTGDGYVSSGDGNNKLTLDIASGSANTFSGVIGDKQKTTNETTYAASGTLSLTKSGAGELILSGANTYTGDTTIKAGLLTITHTSALGSGALRLEAGTTLKSGLRWNNALVLDGNATIESSNNNALFAGATSGNASLTKTGASLLTFNNAPANTADGTSAQTSIYQHGDTIVSAGELQLGGIQKDYSKSEAHRFGTGTIFVENAAKFSLGLSYDTYGVVQFASDITVRNGGTLEALDGNHNFTGTLSFGQNAGDITTFQDAGWGANTHGTLISGKVSGKGTWNIINGDQGATDNLLTLSNSDNDFSGTIQVSKVRLRLNSNLEGASIRLHAATSGKADNTALIVNGENISIGNISGIAESSVYAEGGARTLTLTSNADATYSGIIKDSVGTDANTILSLVKNGTGTQTLAQASYTGSTTIKAGTLTVSSAFTSSSLSIGNTGHLNTTSLTLQGAEALTIDLRNRTTSDTPFISLSDNLATNAGFSLSLTNFNRDQKGLEGTYALMTNTGSAPLNAPGDLTTWWSYDPQSTDYYNYNLKLSDDGKTLFLQLTEIGSWTWDGSSTGDHVWSTSNKNPWIYDAKYSAGPDGVKIIFDDAGSPLVSISGQVKPRSVDVNNSMINYTFSADTAVAGSGIVDAGANSLTALTKKGSGKLTIDARLVNTYSGGTFLHDGIIEMGAANSLGRGKIDFLGGTLSNIAGSDLSISAILTNEIPSSVPDLTEKEAIKLMAASGSTLTVDHSTGGGLIFDNTVNDNTLAIVSDTAGAGVLRLAGLKANSQFTGLISIDSGASLALVNGSATDSVTLSGKLSDIAGTLTKSSGSLALNLLNSGDTFRGTMYASALTINALGSTATDKSLGMSGTMSASSLTLSDDGALKVLTNGHLNLTGSIVLGSGSNLTLAGGTLTLGTSASAATDLIGGTAGTLTLGNGTLTVAEGSNGWTASHAMNFTSVNNVGTIVSTDAGQSITLNGILQDSGTLTKRGSGELIFGNAANTITGHVVLEEGTLQLATGANLGSAHVTVSGGTLNLNNQNVGNATLTITGGALAGASQYAPTGGVVVDLTGKTSPVAMGGLDASVLTKLHLGNGKTSGGLDYGSSITGLTGSISISGTTNAGGAVTPNVLLTVGSGNAIIASQGGTAEALIGFSTEGSTHQVYLGDMQINLTNGLLEELHSHKAEGSTILLQITNGALVATNPLVRTGTLDDATSSWLGSIRFNPILEYLGYAVQRNLDTSTMEGHLNSGRLAITAGGEIYYSTDAPMNGNGTHSINITKEATESDASTTHYSYFDAYKMFLVNGDIDVIMSGGPADPQHSGLHIENLSAGVNTATGELYTLTFENILGTESVSRVNLVNGTYNGHNLDTVYEGNIKSGIVDFVKTGSGILTINGDVNIGGGLETREGTIVLNGKSQMESLTTSTGNALTVIGGEARIGGLYGNGGTLELRGETSRIIIQGNGTMELATHIMGDGTFSMASGTLKLTNGGDFAGNTTLELQEGALLDVDTGSDVTVGLLTGEGIVRFNGASSTLTVQSDKDSRLDIAFEGTGTLAKQGKGIQTLGVASKDLNLAVREGTLILAAHGGSYDKVTVGTSTTKAILRLQEDALVNGLTVTSNGRLNLRGGTTESNIRAGILSCAGNVELQSGATLDFVLPNPVAAIDADGHISLGNGITLNLVNGNRDGSWNPANTEALELMGAHNGFTDANGNKLGFGSSLNSWTVNMEQSLGLFYTGANLHISNDGRRLLADLSVSSGNLLEDVAQSSVAKAGASLIWQAGLQQADSDLDRILSSIMDDVNSGRRSTASQKLAAVAGSSVTSILAAAKSDLNYQQTMLRNRVAGMGLNNNDYTYDDSLPYYNFWVQGTGSYNELSADGDYAGYKLVNWGGTFGADVNVSNTMTLGMAFSANYGDLSSDGADHLSGDLDSTYISLFAKYQNRKWGHSLIVTGSRYDASVDRTVNFGADSYTGNGTTDGAGWGVMYEATYDIKLNNEGTKMLQPLFGASLAHVGLNDYSESGAGNAGVDVSQLDATTGSVTAGLRYLGLVGSNVFGREALGELRMQVVQDMGDDRASGKVGLQAKPGVRHQVDGAKTGATGIQFGAGLSIPVGINGTIFADANTELRSGATWASGSLGYRYNF